MATQTLRRRPLRWTPGQLRRLRGALGFSQQDLAIRLGVSVTTISRWEQALARPLPNLQQRLDELDLQQRLDELNRP